MLLGKLSQFTLELLDHRPDIDEMVFQRGRLRIDADDLQLSFLGRGNPATLRRIAASVSWYGMLRYTEKTEVKPESPLDLAPRLGCPYLGLFGADDGLIPQADVEELRRILEAHHKDFTIVTYPGAGHAFFNDVRPEMFRPDAARDAWTKAIGFFRRHLTGAREGTIS